MRKTRIKGETLSALAFNFPTLFILCFVVLIPIIEAARISLYFYNLKLPHATRFIGFDNYISLFTDPLFWYSLKVTAIFVAVSVVMIVVLGLLFALLLSEKFKGRGILRSILLIPWAVTGVMSGILWRWMYNPEYGLVNHILNAIGIKVGSFAWLSEPSTALLAVALSLIHI